MNEQKSCASCAHKPVASGNEPCRSCLVLGENGTSNHWQPKPKERIGFGLLPAFKALCAAAADDELADAAIYEIEMLQEQLEAADEAVDFWRRANLHSTERAMKAERLTDELRVALAQLGEALEVAQQC